ncbi:MAG TPA: hypothetical protein VEZ11_02980, partial [Thermoanaerobaculia bacterium]|nr:hypothetical protein [Thermoanaerobaculia bacterium]
MLIDDSVILSRGDGEGSRNNMICVRYDISLCGLYVSVVIFFLSTRRSVLEHDPAILRSFAVYAAQ